MFPLLIIYLISPLSLLHMPQLLYHFLSRIVRIQFIIILLCITINIIFNSNVAFSNGSRSQCKIFRRKHGRERNIKRWTKRVVSTEGGGYDTEACNPGKMKDVFAETKRETSKMFADKDLHEQPIDSLIGKQLEFSKAWINKLTVLMPPGKSTLMVCAYKLLIFNNCEFVTCNVPQTNNLSNAFLFNVCYRSLNLTILIYKCVFIHKLGPEIIFRTNYVSPHIINHHRNEWWKRKIFTIQPPS